MKPVLILYATREGQTRRIAEHLAATARARELAADVVNVADTMGEFSLDRYSAAIVAASVHLERHEQEMIDFVRRHRVELERMPAVFLSVSLAEAGAEAPAATAQARAKAAEDVEIMIDRFLEETGWHPSKVQAAAGALMYTRYGPLTRFVMRRIARKVGASTDASRDHEFTDWEALDRLVDSIAGNLTEDRSNPPPEHPPAATRPR